MDIWSNRRRLLAVSSRTGDKLRWDLQGINEHVQSHGDLRGAARPDDGFSGRPGGAPSRQAPGHPAGRRQSGHDARHSGAITFGMEWGIGDFNVGELIETAEIIDSLPFVKLEHVVRYKTIRSSTKDLWHLSALKASGHLK